MLAVKYCCFILRALINAELNCSLYFFGVVGVTNNCDIRIGLTSLPTRSPSLSVKQTHSGAWSKHTCADVTRAACGLTSVFRLEPYQRGEWAPVSVAAR